MPIVLNMEAIRGWMIEAGDIARRYFGQVSAEWKGVANPVTVADREIEQLLTRRIRAAYPEHGIIGEEYGGMALDGEYLWTVDPIDGTRVFVEGLPSWSITLALLHRYVPVFGLVYIPLYDDWTYTAGDDVIHNGQVITVQLKTRWEPDSYVFARSDVSSGYNLRFTRIMTLGTSASHIAYTARGASVVTLIHDSYLWDIAAGAAFMAKQGGEIRYLSGELMDFATLDMMQPIKGMYLAGHPDVICRMRPLISPRDTPIQHPAW